MRSRLVDSVTARWTFSSPKLQKYVWIITYVLSTLLYSDWIIHRWLALNPYHADDLAEYIGYVTGLVAFSIVVIASIWFIARRLVRL